MHPVQNDAKNIKINEILEIYLQLYSDALLRSKCRKLFLLHNYKNIIL